MSFSFNQIIVDSDAKLALVTALKAAGEPDLARKVATWPHEFATTEDRIVVIAADHNRILRAFTDAHAEGRWPKEARVRFQNYADDDAIEIAQSKGLV